MTTIHPLGVGYARMERIASALDHIAADVTPENRAKIFDAIIHPTRKEWRAARLIRVTFPSLAHARGLTLWQLLMLVHDPTPEQSVMTPTGAQIITALARAEEFA